MHLCYATLLKKCATYAQEIVTYMLKNVHFCRACKQSIRLVRLIGRADGIGELPILGKSLDSVGCSLSVDSLTET